MDRSGFSLILVGLLSLSSLMVFGISRQLNQQTREIERLRQRQSLSMLQGFIRSSIDCSETFSKNAINPKSPGTKCLSSSSHFGQQTSDET